MIRALALFLALCAPALADSFASAPAPTAVLPSTYTVATLPPPSANLARYAFVTDLGGGADMVLSDGTNWKHIRQGIAATVPAASTVAVAPLSSPPIMILSGSSVLAVKIILSQTNLYPGYTIHLIIPSGVMAAASTLVISVAGSTPLTLTNFLGMWQDLQWNGTSFTELAKGSL